MAWYDSILPPSSTMSDDDRKQLINGGLLQAGLQILGANSTPGVTPGMALSGGLLSGLNSVGQGAQQMQDQRQQAQDNQFKQASQQDQVQQMQRRHQIQDLATKFAKPDGTFDQQGYRNALYQIDPGAAQELDANDARQKLVGLQTQKAQRDINTPQTRELDQGNNKVTQEQQADGSWQTIATGSRFAPQQSAGSALAQKIATMKQFGATDDDVRASLGFGTGASGASTVPGDTSLTGQAYVQSITDPAMRSLIQQIANGQQQIPKVYRGGKAGEIGPLQIGQMVAQADPTFDQADPNSRIKARADFTSGASAKQIQQLNTLLGHLVGLSDATDKLNNSGSTDYNKVTNNLSSRFGSTNVTNFNQAAQPAAEEFAAIMKGSGAPTEQEIRLQQANLNPANTPDQLHGVIGTMAAQVQSRLDALHTRAANGLGPYASKVNILSPNGRAALDKLRQRGLIPSFHVDEGGDQTPPVPSSAPVNPLMSSPKPSTGGWSIEPVN